METDLKSRTVSGVSWSALSQVITQAFTFGTGIVLARTLGPKAYGLIGMISVFTGFASIFGDLGLGTVVIQRKELEPKHLDAAFWVNVAMGTFITVVIASLGPVLARFYHEPQLTLLTAVLSLTFILDSLKVVQASLFNRNIQFKPIAKVQIWSTVSGGLVGLTLALRGFGPWSLVVQILSGSAVALGLLWYMTDWRPRLSFDVKAAKELLQMSSNVLGFNLVNYWARSLDNLLIGRYVGAPALGLYDKAYSWMLLPLSQVSSVVGRVMFPALSAIQLDLPKVRRTYLKAISIISLITFPMMVGLFVVSDHFVLVLLGPLWTGVTPILKLFCWVGMLQSITTTTGWIFLSQGKNRLYFICGLISSAVCMLAFLVGIRWGVSGVTWAYVITNGIVWYPLWRVTGGLVGLEFGDMIWALVPQFLCAQAMGLGVMTVGWMLPAGLAPWQYLAIQVPFGIALFLSLVVTLRLEAWNTGCQIFGEPLVRRLKSVFGRTLARVDEVP